MYTLHVSLNCVVLDALMLWDVDGKFQIKVTQVTNLNVSKETSVRIEIGGERERERGGERGRERERRGGEGRRRGKEGERERDRKRIKQHIHAHTCTCMYELKRVHDIIYYVTLYNV